MTLITAAELRSKPFLKNYQFIRQIGEGGMGTVYLAEDKQLQRTVAIKILTTNKSTGSQQDALHEARVLARLNHSNIVQIYHVLHDEEYIALIMEFINGCTLQQFQREQLCSLVQKLQLLCQISEGLAAAHEAGVIHCDLKPANILISDRRIAKISDFGIAQFNQISAADKSTYGSLIAMSPEQLQGGPVDYRSDLFSLGILAFSLVAGRHPFGSGSPQQIAQRICHGKPMDARDIIPAIPSELAFLLNQLLQGKASMRPGGTNTVAEKLQYILIAETQQEIIAQQTAPLNGISVVADHDNKFYFKIKAHFLNITLITTLIAVFIGAYFYKTIDPDIRQIVVIKPTFKNNGSLAGIHKDLVAAAIDDSLRQIIINTKNMNLIANSEMQNVEENIRDIAKATGATDIITTELDCNSNRCNVTTARLGGENWVVIARQQWPTLPEDYNNMHTTTQKHFNLLYPEFDKDYYLPQHNINEQDYLQYLKLYADIQIHGLSTDNALEKLRKVIIKSPYLYFTYGLFRETALNLYSQTLDKKYPEQLQELMANAPPEYKYSLFYAIDNFWLASNIGALEEAERYIHMAIERGIDIPTLTELQAQLALDSNELQQAVQYYRKAYKLRPSTRLLYNLASSYWHIGDISNTENTLTELLSIFPEDYDANQLQGAVYLLKGDIISAITSYEKIVKSHSFSIDLSNLSVAYLLIGQYDKAYRLAQKAVQQNSDHPAWILNLADVEMLSGRTQQAQLHYQQVIELLQDKNDINSLLWKAQAHVHSGRHESAIKILNEAKKLAPDNGEVAMVAALVYTRLNEKTSAVIQVEEALSHNIGAVWFNLAWFEVLCNHQRFQQLMIDAGNKNRCQV